MPELEITIGEQQVIVTDPETVAISIDYQLEDQEDFQQKTSSKSLDVTIPASLINSQVANTFHNPSVADLSQGEVFRNPQRLVVKAKGSEIMVGKALLVSAAHTELPEEYTYNFYGDNADWMIDMANLTLYDILGFIKFIFTKQIIVDSWRFDGSEESLPYVFAPARYTDAMGVPDSNGIYDDYNMLPEYMKPSLSKYWIIYWGFKRLGYKVKSDFFDTPYFRRQVMPWTWGGFLSSDGTRIDNLKFLAKADEQQFINFVYTGYWDLSPLNDKTNGGYDNNGVYTYDYNTKEMQWAYLPQFNYGNLDAFFHISLFISATVASGGDNHMWVDWYKDTSAGRIFVGTDSVFELTAPAIGRRDFNDISDVFRKVNVNPGDKVIAKIKIRNHPSGLGRADIQAQLMSFELQYTKIPIGTGTIDFLNFTAFKNHLFLDFLRGVIDEANLSVKTDAAGKIVLFEPTHPYVLPGESQLRPGFFTGDFVDWSAKVDLSKKATMTLFSNYNQQVNFKYKNDTNDSIQKIVQDRYIITLGMGRYVLPPRFQTGNKDFQNRFFSALMHYDVSQWKAITGEAPQMVCLVSENSSNTSDNSPSQTTLSPKSAYYKGIINGLGWVFDGEVQNAFPLMFGVNYKPGGENDPVLSYSDERIGSDATNYVIAQGLLKRFFLQRMANIRNGQWHEVYLKLNNYDAAAPWHREFKTYMNQRWELIAMSGYQPLKDDTTKCTLRKWTPMLDIDRDSVYPTQGSMINNIVTNINDYKYSPLKGLWTDIPK